MPIDMRHKNQTKICSNWVKLVKKTNPKTGRFHYTVTVEPHKYFTHEGRILANIDSYTDYVNAWHKHFDPMGCRGSKFSHNWKFRSRAEAEQLITMALLKWGERYVA